MKPILETDKGWTEAIIDNDCELDKFYTVADIISKQFNLIFSNKLNDLDTFYWDFEYNESPLVLHYNIYLGISIFPREFKSASLRDNESVVEISTLLIEALNDLDWSDFENGKTIGTKGCESGTIILDIENSKGARLTLEKECGNIPFAITLGIYGLMFHTHFESNKNSAFEYFELKKVQINNVFELYKIPEGKRETHWNEKHNSLMESLVDMTEIQLDEKQKQTTNNTSTKAKCSWLQKLFS